MNEVIQTIISRRSCKNYTSQPVPQEALEQILQAGIHAPTGMGAQSPKIVVLNRAEDVAQLEKLNAKIIGNPAAHPFYGAGTVLVVLAKKDFFTGVYDGSLVMGNLLLAAHALGLGACWIHRAKEEFESEEGKALLRKWGIEGEYEGIGHCVIGYPASAPAPAKPRKADYIVRA